METYDHRNIEKKWQKKWSDEKIFDTPDRSPDKKNYYLLTEFSYPSGNLHIGHWYAFAVPDIFARYRRMRGDNVLYPTGFDAFGLPAENAAIKRGLHPRVWTYQNIEHMRSQLSSMGNAFDWSREIITCEPDYYRWTQWLFLQFYKNGLVERKKGPVNWCPSCQTVLANEQVIKKSKVKSQKSKLHLKTQNEKDAEGEEVAECERCETEVVQKDLEQWFFAITKYADRLLADLDTLDWPEEIKEAQRNWIGRSEGAKIKFSIFNFQFSQSPVADVEIFTTRPDTLFGATYLVLAPEHEYVTRMLEEKNQESGIRNQDEVREYVVQAKKKSPEERLKEKGEKTGIELKGVTAINPANGEDIPIWVADYVLAHYGTSAIMAVPAHDERDFEFAKKYGLPVRQVIAPETGVKRENEEFRDGGCAAVFDPRRQLYAFAQWSDDQRITFFAGGIDEGENLENGILRELREESGFSNYRHVERMETAFAHYYNQAKKVNRVARATCLLVILQNDETIDRVLESHEKFETVWLSARTVFETWEKTGDRGYDHYKRFLRQSVAQAIELGFDTTSDPSFFQSTAYTGEGMLENSGKFTGLASEDAKQKITAQVGGHMTATYRLRDWLISRQRYWGCPLPIVYDPDGKPHPIPEENLPWKLPDDVTDFVPRGTSPLGTSRELAERTEKIFGAGWRPEVDTLDTFVDSSWYFLRYLDPRNEKSFAAEDKQALWMPVDRYSGGAEHTTMHLLYSRFFYKAMSDLGLTSTREVDGSAPDAPAGEPYQRRLNRGIILGPDGQKMSKSKGNVIDPDEQVERVGADTVKMYLAFIGPYAVPGHYPWDLGGIAGVRRFLERVWRLRTKVQDKEAAMNRESRITNQDKRAWETLLHQTIKKVGEDIEAFKFNTAISALMILTNAFDREEGIEQETYGILLRLLAPFAPHLVEEIWQTEMGNGASVHRAAWPLYDEKLLAEKTITIVVQINGKTRGTIVFDHAPDEKETRERAETDPRFTRFFEGDRVRKVVFISGRLINFAQE